ncbi:heparin lyase I family protein [Rhizobium sp. ARZ01]|uniref:polysaccharide lyase n=1 Tax=Rhizobium sp. ARZ01 TaxID=2769313 RepID=UPI00177F552A|nr:polysaccharide lyase [Rhizobium sp. ARZ01]MBD9371504.1 heparin lyase I family protein [Rhizobium sp. ARZ01]
MLPFARTAFVALALLAAPASSSAEDGAQPKLYDGFDGADFSEAGGLYYRENAEQKAGTVTFQSEVKREGAGALKLSIRPLCDAESEGCSERAEIWEKTALRVPYDKGVWFGFSVLFADPIPQDDHRYLIAQWKREIGPDAEGDFSPFLALRLDNGKLFATIESNYQDGTEAQMKDGVPSCPAGSTPVWLRPETNQMRSLIAYDASWTAEDGKGFPSCTEKLVQTHHGNPLPEPSSGWIDFAIYSKPGPDGTGHIEIFANGKPVVTAKGYIGHNDRGLGENQYFKFGPYRAAGEGEWTLYYDDFRRSPDCIDVLRDEKACALGK